MRRSITKGIAVAATAAALVGGVQAATFAANGGYIVLGSTNTATKATVIKNTSTGAAVKLRVANSSTAPIVTNGRGLVANLYAARAKKADNLQGHSYSAVLSAARTTKAITFTDPEYVRGGNTSYQVGTIPAGTYLVEIGANVILSTQSDFSVSPVVLNEMSCNLQDGPTINTQLLSARGESFATQGAAAHAATVLQVSGTEDFRLNCTTTAGDGWTAAAFIIPLERPRISFIKLDGNSARDLPLAP